MKAYFLLISLFPLFLNANQQKPLNDSIDTFSRKSSNYFQENKGQIHDEFKKPRNDIHFVGYANHLKLISRVDGHSYQLEKRTNTSLDLNENTIIEVQRVDIKWIGSNLNTTTEFFDFIDEYSNYYNIPHHKDGITNVRHFREAKILNIYDGISIKYYFNEGQFEYDYEIAPGVDYKKIKFEINGGDAILNKNGELVIETKLGTITESAPKVFQNGKLLHSEWVKLEDNIWTFNIPEYNQSFALLIDPIVRVWSSYFTGESYDYFESVSADNEGLIYAAGSSTSNNMASIGAFNTIYQGDFDGIITKFDDNGNRLWATYLGGNHQDNIHKIVAKTEGKFIVCGQTRSSNFYTSDNAFQEIYSGEWDGFLSLFNSDGTNIWSTYLGGESDDYAYSLELNNEVIYVCGATTSLNNISTNNAHQTNYGGGIVFGMDGFLMKFNIDGNRIFGTYYGGENGDYLFDVKDNSNGELIVVGYTNSEHNISTQNSHQESFGGGTSDGFFAKFNAEGVRIFSSYLGGSGHEICRTIVFDEANNFYVAGETNSLNAIANANSYQSTFGGGLSDCFLSKFSSNGDLIWSTYLGSDGIDGPAGVNDGLLLDENGNIYLVGSTTSQLNFSTDGAFQSVYNGGQSDGFIANFDASGMLNYCSYYGGSGAENIYGTSLLNGGSFVLVGETDSPYYFSTPGSFQSNHLGYRSGFISKFDYCLNTYSSENVLACKVFIDINGDTIKEPGIYSYKIINSEGCDSIISVNVQFQNLDLTIIDEGNMLMANQENASYQWIDCDKNYSEIPGETGRSFIPRNNGNFAVVITYNGCADTSNCYSVNYANIKAIPITNIKIYPNPVENILIIQVDDFNSEKLNYVIFNMLGQTIHSGILNSKNTVVNFNQTQSSNVYFLRIFDNENTSFLINKIIHLKD